MNRVTFIEKVLLLQRSISFHALTWYYIILTKQETKWRNFHIAGDQICDFYYNRPFSKYDL